MQIHQLVSFLRRKVAGHYNISNVGAAEVEQPAPGWNDLKAERHSFLLVSEGQGYRVMTEPVELAS